MTTKKVKRRKLKGEKFVIIAIFMLIVATPLLNVYTQTKLSESNIEVEKLKQNIEYQSSINESLNMKINELASLDKIREVASEEGLSYNNDNIKVIEKN
ncbi:MAG: cell division protein FtsL [Bacilli bacterium]|nr:cell division protein FtsL [Bacilli bacterium]